MVRHHQFLTLARRHLVEVPVLDLLHVRHTLDVLHRLLVVGRHHLIAHLRAAARRRNKLQTWRAINALSTQHVGHTLHAALVARRVVRLMHHLEDVLLITDLTVRYGIHWLYLARRSRMLVIAVQTPIVAAVAQVIVRLVRAEVRVSRPSGYPLVVGTSTVGALPE